MKLSSRQIWLIELLQKGDSAYVVRSNWYCTIRSYGVDDKYVTRPYG